MNEVPIFCGMAQRWKIMVFTEILLCGARARLACLCLVIGLATSCGLDPQPSSTATSESALLDGADDTICGKNNSCLALCKEMEAQCIAQHPAQKSFCQQALTQCLNNETETVLATIRPAVGSGDPTRVGTGGGGAPTP